MYMQLFTIICMNVIAIRECIRDYHKIIYFPILKARAKNGFI